MNKRTDLKKTSHDDWVKAVERYNQGDRVDDIATDMGVSRARVYQFMQKLYKRGVLVGIDRPRRRYTSFHEVYETLKYGPKKK